MRRVWSLGWKDPLEEGIATPSSIPAWRIPWIEEPGELQSMGLQSQTQPSDFHFQDALDSLISWSLHSSAGDKQANKEKYQLREL